MILLYCKNMKKKLYRNLDEKMLAGVAAGLADYFGFDPAIWRLAFLLLTVVTGGAFLFIYLAAWIIVPARPQNESFVRDADYTVHE